MLSLNATRAAGLLLGLAAPLCLGACQSPRLVPAPPSGPVGQVFPSVAGRALDGTPTRVPEDLAGRPAVLLVGYVQGAQADLDRWIRGLKARGTPARVMELPTIPSRLWSVFSKAIDGGMRNGIPREQWVDVLTLWGAAAEPVVRFVGSRQPLLGRVFLLDRSGRVIWFHDRGFDEELLGELDRMARSL